MTILAAAAVVGVAGVAAYRIGHDRLTAEVYRQRLHDVADDLERMRTRYNRAVRRSAVTELRVEGGELSVVIRTPEGVLATIPTDVDPAKEVYVDYVVKDGRLWVRRVFDDATSPSEATVIDPSLVDLDWDAKGLEHGKAVYRRLNAGRWVVTVTGGGSLGLRRAEAGEDVELQQTPIVEPFEPVEAEAKRRLEAIGVGDVVRALVGGVETGTARRDPGTSVE